MRKKWDISFSTKFLAVLFILNLAFMILRGGESLFSSDILASDIIVQELHSRGGGNSQLCFTADILDFKFAILVA